MNKKFYFSVFKELIRADLVVFRQLFVDRFINLAIWVVLVTFVAGYIMPFLGLATTYGGIQLAGVIAATGLFELYSNAIELVTDFYGNRTINYSLTLPIPSWLAILSKASYFFITYIILALSIVPIGKLCLWNQLDLMQINYIKFLLIIIFQSMFYASFVLWASSIINAIVHLRSIWARYIFPMWFIGGFQFSWKALYQVMPAIAFINLFNPMIYITEAVRASMLGQADYINFWLCLLAILIFSVLCLAIGMRNLKKKLDFI